MSSPIPLTREESRAFHVAVCERLGIDPNVVQESDFNVEVTAGDELGRVSLTAWLPAEELMALMNEHRP